MNRARFLILGCALLAVTCFVACGGYPEEQTVKIVVTGADDAKYDEISEKLKGMTDGSSHMTYRMNDTITLAPVTDFKAFADKIDFGTVTKTDADARTVYVTIGEVEPAPAPADGADGAADGAAEADGAAKPEGDDKESK